MTHHSSDDGTRPLITTPDDTIAEVSFAVEILNTRHDILIRFSQWGELLEYCPVWFDLPKAARQITLPPNEHEAFEERLDNWHERLRYLLPILTGMTSKNEPLAEYIKPIWDVINQLWPNRLGNVSYPGHDPWILLVRDAIQKQDRYMALPAIISALAGDEKQVATGIKVLNFMQGEICAPLTCLLGEEDIIHCLKISLTPFIFDLLQAKLNTTNQQMRHTAIKVLGESEYDPATPILLYHWEKFPADQDEVLKALTILADKRAAPALNHALTIATASDKYNILNPITAIGDPIVLETLLREAAHENCKLYSFTGLANFPKNELAELALLTFLDKVDTQWNDIASISRALQSVGSHHSILPLTHKLIKAKLALPDRDAATACKFIIKTLGELGNQETAKILVEYCEFNDKDTTLAIIEALGNLKSADSIAFLRQAITTETALEIAKALGKINTKESRAILIDMIKSDENKIIEAGINAVGEIGSKDAVSVLIQQISNASQRRSALKVLKKIGDPAMADELYDFAVKQSNKSFMPEVWSLLGYIGDKRAFPVLLGYLKKTNLDVSHKKSVILALGQHGNMDACKMLRSMLGKEPAVVTGAILHALGQLKDDKDFPLLARAINSPIRAEVSGAVSGLEYFNTKQSVVLLISALDSVWPDVQKKARLVLVRNGHPLGTEALIEGLNSPYPNRQQEYAKSLGASLDDKIIEVLIKTLNSPHQQLRITVIKALANTNTPEAKKSIEKMLNDPCRMVRNAAFEALNNHHNKSFQPGWNMNFDDLEETINDLNEKMINAHLGINSNKENSLSFPPEKQFFQPARILNFL